MAYLDTPPKLRALFKIKKLTNTPRSDRDTSQKLDEVLGEFEKSIEARYEAKIKRLEEDAKKYYTIRNLLK